VSWKNNINITEVAPKLGLALFDPKKQSHRNPDPSGISRILQLRGEQTWPEAGPEAGVRKYGIFARTLSAHSAYRIGKPSNCQ
jgi:hypothetical protein